MRGISFCRSLAMFVCSAAFASAAYAGPVIIGGDDLTDHGSASTYGVTNLTGWLYIEKAIGNLASNVTRPGNNGSIAALGSAASLATSSNAGAAIGSVAQKLGKTVTYYRNDTDVQTFFNQLTASTTNPAIIWISGTGASNDFGDNVGGGAVLATNASAIASFVASGGGLMVHSSQYNFLTTLLPGIVISNTCNRPVTLTPAGVSAFPGLSNADVSAGPCHASFSGQFGGLQVLGTDTGGLVVFLGGGATTTITPTPIASGPPSNIPTLSVWALILLSLLIGTATFAWSRRRT